MNPPQLIRIGDRFGQLTVVSRAESDAYRNTVWQCVCNCGGVRSSITKHLRSGKHTSCRTCATPKRKIPPPRVCLDCAGPVELRKRLCPACVSARMKVRVCRHDGCSTVLMPRQSKYCAVHTGLCRKCHEFPVHASGLCKGCKTDQNTKAYWKDPDAHTARARAFNKTPAGKAAKRRYREAHPEIISVQRKNAKIRRRGAPGKFTIFEWRKIVDLQGSECAECGVHCKLTVDHVIPISRGGPNLIWNIQGLCVLCNSRKSAQVTEREIQFISDRPVALEWFRDRGIRLSGLKMAAV